MRPKSFETFEKRRLLFRLGLVFVLRTTLAEINSLFTVYYYTVGSAHLNTTVSAPSEQPGVKRKEEMKLLYGKHASEIMALEASLQLNFDKNCDTRQPVFWPSIPLKF